MILMAVKVSARNKIIKPVGVQPTELEMQVAQALFDLEVNVAELKADLRLLQFNAAKEVRV
jgi:small subunit ribosomal protein S7e